jgi:hypothetical protein
MALDPVTVLLFAKQRTCSATSFVVSGEDGMVKTLGAYLDGDNFLQLRFLYRCVDCLLRKLQPPFLCFINIALRGGGTSRTVRRRLGDTELTLIVGLAMTARPFTRWSCAALVTEYALI